MRKLPKYCILASFFFLFTTVVFARGGGGGSGGGGGGSGGGGGFGGGSTGSSEGNAVVGLIKLAIIVGSLIYAWYVRRQKIKKAQMLITKAKALDASWDETLLKNRVTEVFFLFQKDWTDFNVEGMKNYLTEEYYKRMVLEMAVLKSQHRRNIMQDCKIVSLTLWGVDDREGTYGDMFTMEVKAGARDMLVDTDTNSVLYQDGRIFIEYWNFVREGEIWKLDVIRQATESVRTTESQIQDFAKRNNFYYDPDFGWLMMPNKGAIFRRSNFKTSDINNHVIGVYREKIVEFYTYIPYVGKRSTNPTNYLVAQTTLPVFYNDILVHRKRWLWNITPRGLRRIHTESNDFDRKFCLYAHPNDQINSFVLLAPDFMEEIYNLPFELNIEIVGSFLYFYVKNRKNVNEDEMMRLLARAFDSMRHG